YKEVLKEWKGFKENVYIEFKGREQLLKQPLFLNPNIRNNRNTFFYKNWFNAGLKQVKDILYEVKTGFLPVQAIIDTLEENEEIENKQLIKEQYCKIKEAVPVEWIKSIDEKVKANEKPEVFLKRKDETISFNACILKMFYGCLCNAAFERPKSIEYWEKLFKNFDASNIWRNVRMNLKSPMLENFDYLLRHNCIKTDMVLCKIGLIRDEKCKVCMEKKEGVLHLFLNCKKLNGFMKMLKKMIGDFLFDKRIIVEEWETMFLFGFNGKSKNKFALNLMLTVARFAIWRRRNLMKQKKVELSISVFYKQILRDEVKVLYDYFYMNGKMEIFEECIIRNNAYIVKASNGFEIVLPENI
ncbi:MAG: hypothetical protein ACRCSY_00005, partial [Cetobacterium sp.]